MLSPSSPTTITANNKNNTNLFIFCKISIVQFAYSYHFWFVGLGERTAIVMKPTYFFVTKLH